MFVHAYVLMLPHHRTPPSTFASSIQQMTVAPLVPVLIYWHTAQARSLSFRAHVQLLDTRKHRR